MCYECDELFEEFCKGLCYERCSDECVEFMKKVKECAKAWFFGDIND